MRNATTSAGRGGRLIVAVGAWFCALRMVGQAQLFDLGPVRRPPADVPGGTPAPGQNLAPPASGTPATAPKGPMLQSLPPASAPPAPTHAATVPTGQVALMVSARYGRELPAI